MSTTLSRYFLCLSVIVATLMTGIVPLSAEEITLPNPGFEDNLIGWNIPKVDKGKSYLSSDAAHSGKLGIEINDGDKKEGSEMFSDLLPAFSGKEYQLSFWGKNVDGGGMGVYLVFYGEERKPLTGVPTNFVTIAGDTTDWKQYQLAAKAPEGTQFLAIRLHSYGAALVKACMDDFSLKVTH